MTAIARLHAGLRERPRPETVARIIGEILLGQLSADEMRILAKASSGRDLPYWMSGWYSSMPEVWEKPADASEVLASVATAWQRDLPRVDATDPGAVLALVDDLARELGAYNLDDFKQGRLNRPGRRLHGSDLSHRIYNRRWRALHRLVGKAAELDRQQTLHRLLLTGRVGFAPDILPGACTRDPEAACFVAYFTARKNLRREFTLDGRENPFDEIAAMLYARCEANPDTDWAMIATVKPDVDVLARLSDEEKGYLLGRWSAVMRDASAILQGLWESGDYDRQGMIVRRGNDSATWNTTATAYNTARSSWLNLLASAGALDLLDAVCPGKVMRLMAADLAYWHRRSGGGLDPNTQVWGALPLPWEVLDGSATCARETVEAACDRAGLNPETSGWTAPRAKGAVAAFKPTPELVHGVAVADPVWAGLLRKAGVFSGKGIRPNLAADAFAGIKKGVVVGRLPATGG